MAPNRLSRWQDRTDGHRRKNSEHPVAKAAAEAARGVTIRLARAEDARSLRRLAALDSAEVPSGALVVAEVSDELWAAVPLAGGRAIADPFRPTAELLRLLQLRAEQLRPADEPEDGRSGLTRTATSWRWRPRATWARGA